MTNIYVSSGQVSSANVVSGDTEYVLAGGATQDQYMYGTRYVSAGGLVKNGYITGTDYILSGGSSYQGALYGTRHVESDGVANNTWVQEGGTLDVASAGVAEDVLIFAGGSVQIQNDGVVSGGTISGGALSITSGGTIFGTLTVSSGGVESGGTVGSGGIVNVSSGGSMSGISIAAGGAITVESGGAAISAIISSGGSLTFTGGGSGSYTDLRPGGTLNIGDGTNYDNQHQTSLTATTGAQINVLSGGTLSDADAAVGGAITVESGGSAISAIISSGGKITVNSGGSLTDTTITTGAEINVSAGAMIGGVTISGGSANIAMAASGTVILAGDDNAGLTLSGSGDSGVIISGFNGTTASNSDTITLSDVKTDDIVSVSYPDSDHVTFTMKDGSTTTLHIIDVERFGYTLASDADGDAIYEVCFLAGTLIRTPEGDHPVEDIRIGDEINVFDWKKQATHAREVVWVGSKTISVNTSLPDDTAGYPVRILKDAISDGVPYKDMLITAEHCLFFAGAFIPVRMLVNGRSILYDKSITTYDYYHIETEQHSVIIADGMLTESYLDTGNRFSFTQHGNVVLFGKGRRSWTQDGAAPLTVTRKIVEPLYREIGHRAEEKSIARRVPDFALTLDPDLHLVTDKGLVIRKAREANGRLMFMIPAGVRDVRIVSRTSRPCDTIGPFVDDRRYLGALVGEITLFDSNRTRQIQTHLTEKSVSGWDVQEAAPCRWTNGNALLPLGERRADSIGMLAIEIKSAGPYLEGSGVMTAAASKADRAG